MKEVNATTSLRERESTLSYATQHKNLNPANLKTAALIRCTKFRTVKLYKAQAHNVPEHVLARTNECTSFTWLDA